ncbi:hypothetical protein DM01DRAFT_1331831 [Hesseltinella vesiculosa]|uniref:Uncharacterized protein n=1 Tax=Hesseltinella vesiculosa TaxID=101127 RepID=A0A1X2GWI6_9FUNG|nr:hypothetical protein DM01DRAFT_1331831 [Hesseltinella vesiculosa]
MQSTARTTTDGQFFQHTAGMASASLLPFITASISPIQTTSSTGMLTDASRPTALDGLSTLVTDQLTRTTSDNHTGSSSTSLPPTSSIPTCTNDDTNGYPTPSIYLFDGRSLADESAMDSDIIPFIQPPLLTTDKASLLAGVLESLVQVMDELPGHSPTRASSASCSSASSSTASGISFGSDDLHRHLGNGLTLDDDILFDDQPQTPTRPINTSSSHHRRPSPVDQDDTMITGPWSPLDDSVPETPLSSVSNQQLDTPSSHSAPNLTILALTSFKAILWPSILVDLGLGCDADLNLVLLVASNFSDQHITEILSQWKAILEARMVVDQHQSSMATTSYLGQKLFTLAQIDFIP